MAKKKKNLELRIYEALGVKIFRKMAFGLVYFLKYPFTLKKTKEERIKSLFDSPSNYIMKKGNGLQDLRDFKKELILNSSIHAFALIPCILGLFSNNYLFFYSLLSILNVYCIMLQRYNWVRINSTLKKYGAREERKKEAIKEEIRENDKVLPEHVYKVIKTHDIFKMMDKEVEMDFGEVITKADLKELMALRNYLEHLKIYMERIENLEYMPQCYLDEHKTLKLELKPKSTTNK